MWFYSFHDASIDPAMRGFDGKRWEFIGGVVDGD
jgi:hypothetical protein